MANNLKSVIEGEYGKPLLKEIQRNKRLSTSNEYCLEVLSALYDVFYEQIHGYLAPKKSSEAEAEIKSHISYINKNILPFCEDKLSQIGKQLEKLQTSTEDFYKLKAIYAKYEQIYDGYFALVAFRSFKHYVLYLEQDFPEKVFEPAKNCFEGYWYYATKMVVDRDVQFLEVQCPTGYGKSISGLALIAFIFGQDINNDVIRITGARGNIIREFDSIIGFLCSKQHAKVFPYFAQFDGKREKLFASCSISNGSFKINGSKKPKNFYFVSREVDINGERARFLFVDDITQATEAGDMNAHEKHIYKYTNEWFKRNYNQKNFYIVASGTTYNEYDLLSYLKKKFGFENAEKSKINKYTYFAKSNALVEDGTSAFVVVPKLDYDTDLSTYPSKFPTAVARQMREENEAVFMAMEQQDPLPPEDTPFYWTNIQTYTSLPKVGEDGRADYCYATLDPARKGMNYVAMPIMSPIGNKYAFVDCLYELKTMEECYNGIIAKIVQHHITWLIIENNTDTSLKSLIEGKLKEQGITFCKVTDVFSFGNKEVRIFNQETSIKNNIIFPDKNMYSRSSPMGKAMLHIISFSYKKKNSFDDSIDAVAIFSEQIIQKKVKLPKIQLFYRK